MFLTNLRKLLNDDIALLDRKITFQLGKKGSGKTVAQNVWLGDKNELLEEKKIFWVRLDVEKLHKLREKKNRECGSKEERKNVLVNSREYFLGQLLYVFCKRFKEFPYLDSNEPESNKKNKCTSSGLIREIYNKLLVSDKNVINEINLTKKEEKHYEDLQIFFQSRLSKFRKQNCTKITDYLSYLEEIIAIDENTWREGGKTRAQFAPDRKKSFLIDDVFKSKNSATFKSWQYLGNTLRKFILDNDYRILYMVDGIDNIYFENPANKEKYEELIEELLDFPINPGSDGTGNDNEFIFMAMRDSSFTELKKRYEAPERSLQGYLDTRSRKIFMDDASICSSNINEILKKRMECIRKSRYVTNSKMAEILFSILKRDHMRDTDLEKMWNSNYRSFLYSRLYLAKYLTFRFYWQTSRKDFYSDKDIENDIGRFEDINLYLNGEMYAQGMSNDDGTIRFSIFGFINEETEGPLYFIYTYILQAIERIDKENRHSSNIVNITTQFGFSRDNCQRCINNLEKSGMLEQRFDTRRKEFAYDVTKKGKFVLEKFYSCVQYLYHSCLDAKLSNTLFDSIKGYISPNDVPSGGDRNFAVNCIIVGSYFLNFLKFEYEKMLQKEKHINKDFQIPINRELLEQSIRQMLEIVIKKKDHVEILEKWLQTIKRGKKNV